MKQFHCQTWKSATPTVMRTQKQQQGFTLIEILIVIAIIAILGAFAYPSYVEQVRKSERVDAKIGLQELLRRQEEYFTRNFTYAKTLGALGYNAAATQINSPELLYTLTISSATSVSLGACASTQASPCTKFVLQAIPVEGGAQEYDTQCAKFTLNNMGGKEAFDSADASTTAECW